MTNRRIIVLGIVAAPFVVALAVYVGMLHDGTASAPDVAAIIGKMTLGTIGAVQIAVVIVVGIVALMAALAPIIYAIRSEDLVTVLISLAMTGTALALLFSGKTVFDQIISLMIYLANIILAAIVYAAHRIAPNR